MAGVCFFTTKNKSPYTLLFMPHRGDTLRIVSMTGRGIRGRLVLK